MQAQRLSYETAGAALVPRGETSAPPRPATLVRVPAGLEATLAYGQAPAQARRRRVVIAGMVAVHAVAVVTLLAGGRLREVSLESKPMFLAVVEAANPPSPPKPLPPPPTLKAPPPQQINVPLIAPELPAPMPSPMVAQAPVPPPPPAAAAPAEAPPTPVQPSLPKVLPAAAVQFLVPLAPAYPRMSRKLKETGRAVVRVWIDEGGLPRNVQIGTSTGFSRLDEAAVDAVRNCRFKPYLENGVAVAGWATVPVEFELS